MEPWRILVGDARQRLAEQPENFYHACATSPPYLGIRCYGTDPVVWGGNSACVHRWQVPEPPRRARWGNTETLSAKQRSNRGALANVEALELRCGCFCAACGAWKGELGSEPTPELFVEHLVEGFAAVRRVLRPDGTLWVNLDDSYASHWPSNRPDVMGQGSMPDGTRQARPPRMGEGIQEQELMGVPWMFAFAMRRAGWRIRAAVTWVKRSTMPESCRDRPSSVSELIFQFTQAEEYYYDLDAVREPSGAQLRNVWTLGPEPSPSSHTATFPSEIPDRIILLSTSQHGVCGGCGAPYRRIVQKGESEAGRRKQCGADARGEYHGQDRKDYALSGAPNPGDAKSSILDGMRTRETTGWARSCRCATTQVVPARVLDPFSGSGTTVARAKALGRQADGCEINPQYAADSRARIAAETGALSLEF